MFCSRAVAWGVLADRMMLLVVRGGCAKTCYLLRRVV